MPITFSQNLMNFKNTNKIQRVTFSSWINVQVRFPPTVIKSNPEYGSWASAEEKNYLHSKTHLILVHQSFHTIHMFLSCTFPQSRPKTRKQFFKKISMYCVFGEWCVWCFPAFFMTLWIPHYQILCSIIFVREMNTRIDTAQNWFSYKPLHGQQLRLDKQRKHY